MPQVKYLKCSSAENSTPRTGRNHAGRGRKTAVEEASVDGHPQSVSGTESIAREVVQAADFSGGRVEAAGNAP